MPLGEAVVHFATAYIDRTGKGRDDYSRPGEAPPWAYGLRLF